MMHSKYDILQTCRALSYQNNLCKVLYGKHTHTYRFESQFGQKYTPPHTHTHPPTRVSCWLAHCLVLWINPSPNPNPVFIIFMCCHLLKVYWPHTWVHASSYAASFPTLVGLRLTSADPLYKKCSNTLRPTTDICWPSIPEVFQHP